MTYIENYSFWLDIKLILLTFKILFQKENTEGLEDWQNTAATEENLERLQKDTEETDRQGIGMSKPADFCYYSRIQLCRIYLKSNRFRAGFRMWIWKLLSLTTVPEIILMR